MIQFFPPCLKPGRSKIASLLVFLFTPTVHAVVPCTANSQFKNVKSLAKPVAVIGRPDRKVDKKYASDRREPVEKVRARYAATGDFHCDPNDDWGGQLTVRGDVVTTSAHGFINDDCTKRYVDYSKCRFTLVVDGKERSFQIANLEASGYMCNRQPFTSKDDWAVVKLKELVPSSVKPYRVDKAVTARVMAGSKVVAVGKSSDFYYQSGNKIIMPKHYADCEVGGLMVGREKGTLATDCDSAERTSGSSVLSPDVNDPVLVGIHSGSRETREQLEQAWKNHRPNTGKFDAYEWASYATPVSGELFEVLSTY